MKTITWITAEYFIDVDNIIVPFLAKKINIHWILVGGEKVKKYCDDFNSLSLNENLNIECYVNGCKWYLPQKYFTYKSIFQYADNLNSDLIYVNSMVQFWTYYAALRFLPKEKTVFAVHNVKIPKGARLEWWARYYMNNLLANFDNFHVFSKNQRAYLESIVLGKNVLYAPLTLKDYGKKPNRVKHIDIVNFLSFGHIRNYKRVDLLIDAAQKVYEETKINFKVTIAGNCSDWYRYAKMIRYPELFDLNIGYIEDDNVASFFANADYLVLPYQDLAQSGAITVAFNYDVPVITSNIEQFKEFVEEGINGYMFKSEDVESLKNVLKFALFFGHGNDYKKLVNTTVQFVRNNYVIQTIADKYIDYFNNL